jgi:glycine betaine/proline transport system substrate-binding protein
MKEESNKKIFASLIVVAMVALVSVLGAGCLGDDDDESLGTIKFGYVLWEGEIASTNVMTLVLEEAGYDVEMVSMDAGILYQSLADGSVDFSTSAWLPATQANYWDVYGDDIDSVATNLEGCSIGLAVPSYIEEVDSIADLADYSNEFDSTIVGIDPGAGMMTNTETAMETYGLEDWSLVSSSSAGMLAELTSAYDDEEWIVVTLWTPHWAFMKMDLKMLEDPEGDFGGAEHVQTLARQGLQEDMPEAYEIIERFYWTQADIQGVMLDIQEGMDEVEAAQNWIDANRETVDFWLTGE